MGLSGAAVRAPSKGCSTAAYSTKPGLGGQAHRPAQPGWEARDRPLGPACRAAPHPPPQSRSAFCPSTRPPQPGW